MEAWKLLRQIMSLLTRYRPQIYRATCWIMAFQFVALVPQYIVASMFDVLSRLGPAGRDAALLRAGALAVVQISMGFMKARKDGHTRSLVFEIIRDFPPLCLEKLMRLPQSYHERENTGQVMGKVFKGVGRLIDLSFMVLHEILPLFGMAVMTIGLALYYDWRIALILVATMVVFAFLALRSHARLVDLRRERHGLDTQSDAQAGQAVTNVMTTQVFCQEVREVERQRTFAKSISEMFKLEYDSYDQADAKRNSLVSTVMMGVVSYCVFMVSSGRMPLVAIMLIVGLSERLFTSCYRIGWFYSKAVECMEPIQRIVELLELPETVKDPAIPLPIERFKGEILFSEVSYGYKTIDATPGTQRLRQVSFLVHAGETVAIVGESGAGKSTVAKLLLRFDDPDQGGISIDGNDLRGMLKADFRRQIGYVPQEVEIYDMSVGENIAYGRPDASRHDIQQAAHMAGALNFIQRDLDQGFETRVGNRGMKLSGGQRQRIGIARALLLDPAILVFDEATSNVDAVTEAEIQRTMREQSGKRTIILIAHRLSTVRHADRILVMDQGRIVEAGKHEDLMRRRGIYANLVRAQERAEQAEAITEPKIDLKSLN